METVVRLARPEDLPAIVATFGHERYFRHRLERQSARAGELFIARRGGDVVGAPRRPRGG